jgi:hypothetical protein
VPGKETDMHRKRIKKTERLFKLYDEENKLVGTSASANELADKFRITLTYIYKYYNTDTYFFNNKIDRIKYRIEYTIDRSNDIEPFVIPVRMRQTIVNLPGEVWKQIPDVPNCNWASNKGRFKIVDVSNNEKMNTIIISKNKTKRSYRDVTLENPDGNNIRVRATRVLAKTFIDPEFPLFYKVGSKVVVDHIDNDSLNDDITNLRIISQQENIRSAIYDHGKKFGTAPKKVRNKKTGKVYDSAAQAAREYGLNVVAIANAANPNQAVKSAGEFTWEYVEENNQGEE